MDEKMDIFALGYMGSLLACSFLPLLASAGFHKGPWEIALLPGAPVELS